ncbi:MAG TPA: hypothetical protein VFS18_01040 [Actinomycetota bacterium]|nr:hypothetical protein [Actinomycetota bacterium]
MDQKVVTLNTEQICPLCESELLLVPVAGGSLELTCDCSSYLVA